MAQSRNTIFDFIRRTEKNLEVIEEGAAKSPNEYFEVTQLINSAIGLLVFPTEAAIDRIPDLELGELKDVRLPKVLYGKLPEDTLRRLIRYLRNAFAHHNIYFENYNNSIKGVYVWNYPNRLGKPDWVAYISIGDLKLLFARAAREFKTATENMPNEDALAVLEGRLGEPVRLSSREARA